MNNLDETIRNIAKEKDVSFRRLAKAVGMSEPGLYRSLKNETLKVVALKEISILLEVPISHIMGMDEELFEKTKQKPVGKRDEVIEELRAQMDLLKEQGEMMRSQIRDLKQDKDFLQSIVMEKLGLKLSDLGKGKVVAMPTVGHLRKSA